MDCKGVIANYWNFRSSTYKNGVNGFDEDERKVWKQIFENSLASGKSLKVLEWVQVLVFLPSILP